MNKKINKRIKRKGGVKKKQQTMNDKKEKKGRKNNFENLFNWYNILLV